jgi:hypothetical protein
LAQYFRPNIFGPLVREFPISSQAAQYLKFGAQTLMDYQQNQLRRAAAQAFDESLNALEQTFGADGEVRQPRPEARTLEQAFQDAAADLDAVYPPSPEA